MLLPSHLTPWAVKPQRKLAQSSHQFSPLNVCTLKLCALEYLFTRGLSSRVGVSSTAFLIGSGSSMFSGLLMISDGFDTLEENDFLSLSLVVGLLKKIIKVNEVFCLN